MTDLTKPVTQISGTGPMPISYEGMQKAHGVAPGTQSFPGRLLRGREVFGLVALSRTTIWRRVREGSFPAPVSLGTTRIAWRESDVAAWLAAQRPADTLANNP
jgi:prophage regulatory protein